MATLLAKYSCFNSLLKYVKQVNLFYDNIAS